MRLVGVEVLLVLLLATSGGGSTRRPTDLVVGIGADDLSIGHATRKRAAAVLVEAWAPTSWRRFRPLVGVQANRRGAVLAYGGGLYDLPIGPRVAVTPSLAAGGYVAGRGRDLGHTAEFRTAIQVSYRLPDESRLGVQAQHVSNANLGGGNNMGAESLFLTWSPSRSRGAAGR